MNETFEVESALPRDLKHIPYHYDRKPEKELLAQALEFYKIVAARRTLRFFNTDPVPKEIIREIIRAAGNTCQVRFFQNSSIRGPWESIA